jgi:hypothetical protein
LKQLSSDSSKPPSSDGFGQTGTEVVAGPFGSGPRAAERVGRHRWCTGFGWPGSEYLLHRQSLPVSRTAAALKDLAGKGRPEKPGATLDVLIQPATGQRAIRRIRTKVRHRG